jgi:DNA-binding transcriptional LysR family regulator
MEVNYHHLRLFQTTARLGQMARAAEELHVSQPAISKQIGDLERALGSSLFERIGRRLRLTPAGEIVLAHADQIFGLTDELLSTLSDLKGLRRGRLLLGASTTVGEYLLPRAMGRFKREHPGVEMVLEIANTEHILERVLRKTVDLGFVGRHIQHDAIVVEPYLEDEVVMIAAPTHPLSRKRSVVASDLNGQPFITREPGSATRATAEAEAARLGIEVTRAMALGSNDAVKEAVAAGLGIGLISRHAIHSELRAGELRVLGVREWRGGRQLSIIYGRERRLHDLAQAFLDFVRADPGRGGSRDQPVPRAHQMVTSSGSRSVQVRGSRGSKPRSRSA